MSQENTMSQENKIKKRKYSRSYCYKILARERAEYFKLAKIDITASTSHNIVNAVSREKVIDLTKNEGRDCYSSDCGGSACNLLHNKNDSDIDGHNKSDSSDSIEMLVHKKNDSDIDTNHSSDSSDSEGSVSNLVHNKNDSDIDRESKSDPSDNKESACNFVSESDSSCKNDVLDKREGKNGELSQETKYVGLNENYKEDSKVFLSNWSIKNNITHTALTEILKWLSTKPDLENIPTDARTLLKTPNKNNIQSQEKGDFFYFGLENRLITIVKAYPELSVLDLNFNIDGLPIHKSTKTAFWPILCNVENVENVFAVAIFCGQSKPDLEDFFQEFVEEMLKLMDGLQTKAGIVKINIRSFICDAPAKSFIKNIKNHNGYFGCDKCCIRGEFYDNRIIFQTTNSAKRTDEDFLLKTNKEHHKGNSPLERLNIGMVSKFPIDYMHAVCLGIMKKLLITWSQGAKHLKINKKIEIDDRISNIVKSWPANFNRKPRSIFEIERWKATEFRQFLLYIGPVVLKDILDKKKYANFLIFKFAITILLSKDLNSKYNGFASTLLNIFIKDVEKIYGKMFCIYNLHILSHLSDDAKEFNTLNSINSFKFENYLGQIKRLLRKSNQPLQQVVNRLQEIHKINVRKVNQCVINVILEKQVPDVIKEQYFNHGFYRKICVNREIYTNRNGDNAFILFNNDVVVIKFICKNMQTNNFFMLGQKFKSISPFFVYPENSQIIGFFEVDDLDDNLFSFNINDILCKGVLMQHNNKFVFAKNYYLVEFPEEFENGQLPMAIIPKTWLVGNKQCLWPSFKNEKDKIKAVKNKNPPKEGSDRCQILIKYKTDSYEKAVEKLKKMEKASQLSQSDSDNENLKRPKKPNKKYVHSDIDSETDPLPIIPPIPAAIQPPIRSRNTDDNHIQLERLEGKDVVDSTRRILSKIISNSLAKEYNWKGKGAKRAFATHVNIINLLLGSLRTNSLTKNASTTEVESVIKAWLRTAGDRDGGRNRRRQ
ncbi:unnamed protein product [Brassicogethes aeneus]|uniref:DUF4806 domain-containing protein n=1 Tax=Brassicogethes aeneus TaxID=1431903 RepID=A0A9P0AZL5_BRAAE|nr:unnamed protein product [Brassicogethes aeneus]